MPKISPVILDDDEPSPGRNTDQPTRHGFEWGLASTLIGASLIVAGAVAMLFCLIFWISGHGQMALGTTDLRLAQLAGGVFGGGAVVISLLGILFGIRGLSLARAAQQPCALPITGLLLCLAASLLWLIVLADLMMIINSFLRWRDY